jgi:hypothetical protein
MMNGVNMFIGRAFVVVSVNVSGDCTVSFSANPGYDIK